MEVFLGHNFFIQHKEGYHDCFDSQNNSLRPFNVAKNHKNKVYYDVNLAVFSVHGLYCDVNFPFSYYNPIKPTTEYTAVRPDCKKLIRSVSDVWLEFSILLDFNLRLNIFGLMGYLNC